MGKIPNVFVIVFFLIIFSAVLTWVLPGGSYERKQIEINNTQRTIMVEGSYQKKEANPQILEIFTTPLKGFIKLAEINGFTNMIIPTSGVTIGTLAMAKIPYEKWFKWNLPMQMLFFVISLLFLIWPVLTHWQ